MTAPGATLVPEEPDGLEPVDQDGAPPAPEHTVTELTPPAAEPHAPEEPSGSAPGSGLAQTSTAEDLDLELRGRLTVAKRVVEKIAEQAASEVTGDGDQQRSFAVRPGATATERPTVEVQLEGADAWLTIDVGLTYPTPLRAAADQLRAHLVGRLEELSGVTVKRLDIRISWLGATAEQPRRLR